jgi:hypothetical protein
VIGRVTVLALFLIAGWTVATIDAAPMWKLIALACMAWGVYLVFLAFTNRQPKPQPCSCPTCRRVRVLS